MEFGIFHEFPSDRARSDAEAFAAGFAEVDAAEAMGIDAVWLAELHMNGAHSVLASPLTVAAAIAVRTRRIGIGIGVQVLPLTHPVRLAEEVATVDHLSQGRLVFGVGRSGFPRTYLAYGISYAESRERFAEVLKLMKRIWVEPQVTHEGKYYACRDVTLSPRPYRKPYPPIRVAANSPDTFPAVGADGDTIMVAARLTPLQDLIPNIKAYREAYARAGHAGRGAVHLRIPVYVAPTERQAREDPEASIMAFYRTLGSRVTADVGEAGIRAPERRAELGRGLQTISYEEALRDKLVVGTPEQAIDRLAQLKEELDIDGILAEVNCGGQLPPERVLASMRLVTEKVMPKFK